MEIPHIGAETPHVIQEQKIDQNKLVGIGTDIALLALCFGAAFISFWDVGFSINKAFSIGFLSVILYVVTVTVYRNRYDYGIFRGRQTKEYKGEKSNFEKLRDTIISTNLMTPLIEWCNTYRLNDLAQIRKSFVCPYMTYEEYTEKYQNISQREVNRLNLSRQAKRAIFLANSIKPLELSADKLLGVSVNVNLFGKRQALPVSGQDKRKYDMIFNYASKFLLTFVLGMFSIEILSDPTLETFLQWLVRMFPVATAYLTGEPSGYRNATAIETRRIGAQSQILHLFFADTKLDDPKQGQENEKAE